MRNEVGHLVDVFGSSDQLRLLDVQCGSVFEKCFLVLRRVLLNRNASLCRIANDLVIHVGNVHDVAKFVSTLAEVATKNINRNKGAEVAYMPIVINSRPAGIHADFVVLQRPEILDFC